MRTLRNLLFGKRNVVSASAEHVPVEVSPRESVAVVEKPKEVFSTSAYLKRMGKIAGLSLALGYVTIPGIIAGIDVGLNEYSMRVKGVKYPTKQEVVDKLNEIGIPREHVKGLEIWCGDSVLLRIKGGVAFHSNDNIFWRNPYLEVFHLNQSYSSVLHEISHGLYKDFSIEKRDKFKSILSDLHETIESMISNSKTKRDRNLIGISTPIFVENFDKNMKTNDSSRYLDESFAQVYEWYFYADCGTGMLKDNPFYNELKTITSSFIISSGDKISSKDLNYNTIGYKSILGLYLCNHRNLYHNLYKIFSNILK
jgi:hypothetical protein